VAASSCFPGGFEPMVLPDDFDWSGADAGSLPAEARALESLPLMDGGITDNQGLGSLRLADQCQGVELDLLVISDTDNTAGPLLTLPSARLTGGPRLWLLALLGTLAALVVSAAGLTLLVDAAVLTAARGPRLADDLLRLWIPGAACAGAGLLLAWLLIVARRGLRRALPRGIRGSALRAAGGLSLGELRHVVAVRLASLVAVVSHVFTRRIRRAVFDATYEDEAFRGRVVPCLMSAWPAERAPGPSPSPALAELVDRARRMPTTLWFECPQQLPDLIACGQASLVAGLLAHLERHPTSGEPQLEQRLDDLWQRLNNDPHALVRERLES